MNCCGWKGLEQSPLYLEYHDQEWGVASYEDSYLFEMFVLESFHCGLSWLLVLKKREAFRRAFQGFDPEKIAKFTQQEMDALLEDKEIIRHAGKIQATVGNAKAFLAVQKEFGSFSDYLWGFTDNKVEYHPFDGVSNRNATSDRIAKDLKKRGFRFMGSVTCYSYLEAVGIFCNHSEDCHWHPHHPAYSTVKQEETP